MDDDLYQLCDQIDAAIFTGCTFTSAEARAEMRAFLARWERELVQLDESQETD